MSFMSASLLAQTIDDHIAWMAAWTRLACFATEDRASHADSLPPPVSFAAWQREASKVMQEQPALERLQGLYEQIHRMARLVLLKAPEGAPVSNGDYDSVAFKYQEFIVGLRRIERAMATAASGLDTLTGLRSRAGMQDDLTRELSRFQRTAKPFCLALMDIDHFKKVNDAYGHEGGDKVLAAVANHISRSLRPFDEAWRWGGEEILICLKEADVAAGTIALERVRTGLEKLAIRLSGGREINVTASFGICEAEKELNIEDMLERADQALYRAKGAGRNRIEAGKAPVVYDPGIG